MTFPVWLRLALFTLFAAGAYIPFLISKRRAGLAWLPALFWGAISLLSVYHVQIPVQGVIQSALVGSELSIPARKFLWVFPSGIIQELFKALVPFIIIALIVKTRDYRRLIGAAAGVGFGIAEAVVLVGLYRGDIGTAAIVERFTTIFFHTGLTALALGAATWKGRTVRLVIVMLLHSGVNFMAILLSSGSKIYITEGTLALISILTWGLALIEMRKDENDSK